MSNQEQLDALLHQLIQQAIASPAGSEQRTAHADSILSHAQLLPGILTREYLDKGLRPYYDDALVLTERSVRRTIDKFPDKKYNLDIANAAPDAVRKKFVNWYNRILKDDCIDLYRSGKKRAKPVELDSPVGEDGAITQGDITPDPRTPEPMEAAIAEEKKRILQAVIRYLQQDEGNELLNCASKKNPICNCREIYRRRVLTYPPERWQDIAESLNLPYGNITSHWDRKCKPLLKEIAQRFGYEPEE